MEEVAVARRVERPEAQRVEDRDRPGTHREDVADDPTDASSGALERLDRAWVVVRFHLHRDRPAVADVDDPGVLTGPLQDPGRLGWEELQQRLRVLVAAVLAPHRAEHAELELGRLAAE